MIMSCRHDSTSSVGYPAEAAAWSSSSLGLPSRFARPRAYPNERARMSLTAGVIERPSSHAVKCARMARSLRVVVQRQLAGEDLAHGRVATCRDGSNHELAAWCLITRSELAARCPDSTPYVRLANVYV